MAAMAPDKSRSLHNFSLPPRLSWGAQRVLRCSKTNPSTGSSSSKPDRKRRSLNSEQDNRIEVMREKLMIDLQKEVDKIKNAILAEGVDAETDLRPWNLRTRRAACREPNSSGGGDEAVKLVTVTEGGDGEKIERMKLSVSLSREEIEDDFMELTKRRPARKPKKRAKYVQKQLDTLFPGLWLSEITPDMYKVNEIPEGQ